MPRYVRAFVPGGTFFFTVNLLERQRTLLTDHIEWLGSSIRQVRAERPFQIHAIVVLPDHLHCILQLPEGDADFSTRWRRIKSVFSRGIAPGERLSRRRIEKAERGIWQRRFWEHSLRSERDFENHVDYIHYNPVKHGHVSNVIDWPYSSFHRYVRAGIYPGDWAGTHESRTLDFD